MAGCKNLCPVPNPRATAGGWLPSPRTGRAGCRMGLCQAPSALPAAELRALFSLPLSGFLQGARPLSPGIEGQWSDHRSAFSRATVVPRCNKAQQASLASLDSSDIAAAQFSVLMGKKGKFNVYYKCCRIGIEMLGSVQHKFSL